MAETITVPEAPIPEIKTPAIKVKNLTKQYRSLKALDNFNLEIPQGSIYGLIGPNGAGKTTLIRILAALLSPTAGQVWVGAEELSRVPTLIQRKIGYMPDFFGVYPDLTVLEYLEFYAGIHGIARAKRKQIIQDLLELVDLFHKREEYVETLSRGMKQRLCLARALVHDPEILLLDEPASGLDPRARVELRDLVRTLQKLGKTIIISSHILPELAEMCTDIGIIQAGKLVLSGDVEQISQQITGSRSIELRLLSSEKIAETRELLHNTGYFPEIIEENEVSLTATFTGDDATLANILALLVKKEIPLLSFAPRSGSSRLEDIFMSITERTVS